MSQCQICAIAPHSPAAKAGLKVGETLLRIGEQRILDVLDYKYYGYEPRLSLHLRAPDGSERAVVLEKAEGEDLGLEFETYLMDGARQCANKCVFCFVDQMPAGLRETLYFKDDDARLSFLMGNYVTLTNLGPRAQQRIIDLHISPLNISVHATEPELRALLLGHPRGGEGFAIMQRFAAAGITMNCQIVACPGLNDGPALQRSMEDLAGLYPQVKSVSIVPVGLTRFREGLHKLRPFSVEEAEKLVTQVEAFAKDCMTRYESSIFWCSDECYLRASRTLPEDAYYEDYIQLENGVGMLRLLETEFRGAGLGLDALPEPAAFSIATGVSAAPFLGEMLERTAKAAGLSLACDIYPIRNDFFGHTIDVAGLITGGDLIAQLRGKPLGTRLLIAKNMLRHGESVFLDDLTLEAVEEALGLPIVPVEQDGFALFEAIFGL